MSIPEREDIVVKKKAVIQQRGTTTCGGLVSTGIQVCVASCEEELRSFGVGERSTVASLKLDKELSLDKEVLLVFSGVSSTLRALRARGR